MASDTRAAMFGIRVAGVASLVSSAIAAVAVALLVLMYLAFGLGATSAGQTFGGINDALTLVAYVLRRARRPGDRGHAPLPPA